MWASSAETERSIESLKMWLYWRLMRISWTSKTTNEEIKDKIKEAGGKEFKILESIKKRKLAYCKCIIWVGCLQSQILLRRLEGKWGRGRLRKTMMEDVKNWGKWKKTTEVVRCAEDRVGWHQKCRQLGQDCQSDWLSYMYMPKSKCGNQFKIKSVLTEFKDSYFVNPLLRYCVT